MKRFSLASALGVGVIVALAVPASAGAAQAPTKAFHDITYTGLHEIPMDPDTVYADITFNWTYSVTSSDELTAQVYGVEVGDGVELPSSVYYYPESEGPPCASPEVDIAADLSSVTVTGEDDDSCATQAGELTITLYQGTFGAVTLDHDSLFTLYDPQISSNVIGSVPNSRVAMEPPLDSPPNPVVFEFGGTPFIASWYGTAQGFMDGTAKFLFAVDADGAQPVPGDPTFTG